MAVDISTRESIKWINDNPDKLYSFLHRFDHRVLQVIAEADKLLNTPLNEEIFKEWELRYPELLRET